jgi:hypothetical protein
MGDVVSLRWECEEFGQVARLTSSIKIRATSSAYKNHVRDFLGRPNGPTSVIQTRLGGGQ